MQIDVTNQKTNSIRSACFEAAGGSQGGRARPQRRPRRRRAEPEQATTMEPLRIRCASLVNRPVGRGTVTGTAPRALPPCTRPRSDSRTTEGRQHMGLGVSMFLVAVGAILAFAVNAQRQRREHPHGRLDPADRRHHRHGALDDLLVVVGRPRLLVDGRRRTTYVDDGPARSPRAVLGRRRTRRSARQRCAVPGT